jgi:uncharacterized RDD family membrane protein YckC
MENSVLTEIKQVNYPSLLLRMQSSFVDIILLLVFMVIVTNIFDAMQSANTNIPDWVIQFLFIFIFFYEPICVSLGCTLGQKIMGIRVRQYQQNQKNINIFFSVLRYIVKLSLGWLSFITIKSNAQSRAIHDIVGQSLVVKKNIFQAS